MQEGKAITGLKAQLEEQQMKKIAEERRREKIETQKAKERVKAQIAADRAAKKEQEARERGEAVPASAHPVASPPPSQSAPSSAPKDYTETRSLFLLNCLESRLKILENFLPDCQVGGSAVMGRHT